MLDVDGIEFDFEPFWRAIKWDDEEAYRRGIGKLPTCKAVDLIGFGRGLVALIEVKDFRHPDAEWSRVTNGSLAEEVAFKVRDTLAGVVGAARQHSPEVWRDWAQAMHASPALRVILWFERPESFYSDPRRKDELQHFRDVLKKKLAWLTSDVFICSKSEAVRLPGVSARDALAVPGP
ncbi:hypothetical protein [Corallococcus exiguus]|uniref:hypothetical protein n=1 Tax=Corallococcus exiguus TaxID=83462 RepID=UPI001560E993|nr:hypothetical protein [Corallococcus exiguus]NRD59216.1 hypothetical protein [Corallococcus exiguus]